MNKTEDMGNLDDFEDSTGSEVPSAVTGTMQTITPGKCLHM